MTSLFLSLVPVLFPAATPTSAQIVLWRGQKYAPGELPTELPSSAHDCVATWAAWARVNDHRMELDQDGLVLWLSPRWNPTLRRHRELVEVTVKRFEELLPSPDRSDEEPPPPATSGPKGRSEPGASGIPEDPEEAPSGLDALLRGGGGEAWGTESTEVDTETVAIFILRDLDAYGRLLTQVARENEHLTEWTEAARSSTGFVVEQPLCGAFVLNDERQEEWNPENELVNRLTQLLVLRRFGQQPYWLVQGIAWDVEQGICGSVYCFPYRQGFVSVDEHEDWDSLLGRRFEGRRARPLEVVEFAEWPRGTYQEEASRLAWGVAHYIIEKHAEKLPGLLEGLRRMRWEKNRTDLGDGRWERNTTFEIPAALQNELLLKDFGADLMAKVSEHFRALAKPVEEEDDKQKRGRRGK